MNKENQSSFEQAMIVSLMEAKMSNCFFTEKLSSSPSKHGKVVEANNEPMSERFDYLLLFAWKFFINIESFIFCSNQFQYVVFVAS